MHRFGFVAFTLEGSDIHCGIRSGQQRICNSHQQAQKLSANFLRQQIQSLVFWLQLHFSNGRNETHLIQKDAAIWILSMPYPTKGKVVVLEIQFAKFFCKMLD